MLLTLLPLAACGSLLGAPALDPAPDHDHLPDGFVDEVVFQTSARLTGFVVDPGGWITFWTKRGEVWVRDPSGLVAPAPLLDLTEEVGDWNDHGLHGFAYDRDYARNGRVYAYYVVDRHYLDWFGTPQYDPGADELFTDTIGRIVRYEVLDPADPFTQVDPLSRAVLLGVDETDGVPICSSSHGIGTLLIGEDGTLLASCGDAALGNADTCFENGIFAAKEDVAFYRAQLVDGRNGRVIRIDPDTGEGVPGNPFFDPLAPASGASRTWVLGLRNPYRVALRPGSGDSDPLAAKPGTLYIGDVGDVQYEELNVAPEGGLNFGWPYYEGPHTFLWAAGFFFDNLDAPNPLYGQPVPGGGTCSQAFFHFQDLLAQDTLHTPSWPNPCDPAQEITSAPTFLHRRAALSWAQEGVLGKSLVEVPSYDAFGLATTDEVGVPGASIPGESFYGNCAIAGAWYQGDDFPEEYRGVFFLHDFGEGWIRALHMDAQDRVLEVADFAELESSASYFFAAPGVEGLWYLQYYGVAGPTIHRIRFTQDGAPEAVATAKPLTGPSPLRVQFDGTGSSDPEDGELDLSWSFGDLSPWTPVSTRTTPVHVYPSEDVTPLATFVSSLDTLAPPVPTGAGSQDPGVLRDGLWPAVSDTDPQLQFDTEHTGHGGVPDKGPLDWIGWVLPAPRVLHTLVFQEGLVQDGLGGWFEGLAVEVRDPSSGLWRDVAGLVSHPAYPGDPAVSFETFQLLFDPVLADGIRLIGAPGGSLEFVSAAELLVFADTVGAKLPTGFQPRLDVTDPGGKSDQSILELSVDNTPPLAFVISPPDGAVYPVGSSSVVSLNCLASDLEHPTPTLSCTWNMLLVHDNHVHPESSIEGCTAQFTLTPHGELQGDVVYWIFEVTVADPLGASSTRKLYLLPAGDCDLDGLDDAIQIATDPALDSDLDGVLDGCQFLSATGGLVSVLSGGSQALSLHAGAAHADELYLLLGSLSGPVPGLVLGAGVTLPLVIDPYFEYTLSSPDQPPLSGSFGLLDAQGAASAAFTLAPSGMLSLIGQTARHAYVMFDAVSLKLTGASNAVTVHLTP